MDPLFQHATCSIPRRTLFSSTRRAGNTDFDFGKCQKHRVFFISQFAACSISRSTPFSSIRRVRIADRPRCPTCDVLLLPAAIHRQPTSVEDSMLAEQMLDTVWEWLGSPGTTQEESCEALVTFDTLRSATNRLIDAASGHCATRIGLALAPVSLHKNENATKVCRVVCFDWRTMSHPGDNPTLLQIQRLQITLLDGCCSVCCSTRKKRNLYMHTSIDMYYG